MKTSDFQLIEIDCSKLQFSIFVVGRFFTETQQLKGAHLKVSGQSLEISDEVNRSRANQEGVLSSPFAETRLPIIHQIEVRRDPSESQAAIFKC